MPSEIPATVNRNANILTILSLSSPFVIGNFIRAIYQGNECGYTDFVLDFSNIEGVYPNVCAPFAGLIEYYKENRRFSFTYNNVPDFLSRTKTLAPSVVESDDTHRRFPLNVVWKFSSAEEVNSLVDAYLDAVSRSAVCQGGVIQGIEWCLNEIMDNVLQHAATTHGYVMGQIHSTSQHMAVCIYDHGQGILNSLRTSMHAPTNAVDAITISLKEGITRDKNIGQGNGMWGLNNIVRSNSGLLNITSGSGFVGIRVHETKTSTTVPYLSSENNCTTVDFQIDFDKGISIANALGGYEPVNFRIENLEDERNNVVYKLTEKSSGTGTRQSGVAIRNEIINISNQTTSVIVLDFNGVSLISSSFADELIGKLVVEYGFIGFTQRFRLSGMNETIQAITNRSVFQRLSVS
ncbi:MAG: STAS-like domain-containing protein [Tildeniella nuda ZEHNDER 1965/U140]|jgi:anti-anti-sigma regulatory factor|nr:STAS-like domain-containing protein [Tildeniella nuda ZEHNDER 1965/U140]